jgi:hypothetical protein
MTRERRLTTLAIVGLGVLCLGIASKAIMSGSLSARGGDPLRLETTSIELTTGSGEATLSARDMAPGDMATAAITLANSGRQPMTYAMSLGLASASGAALAGALVLTIKTVGSSCADFDGTSLFDGPLDKAAFGSQANGRPLPAATAEILCFRAALPLDTGDALQGVATTVTLTFGADLQAAAR